MMSTNSQSNDITEYNLKIDLSERIATRDRVYSILSKAIFRGDLKPGQRLVESKLAELMKVSRTPIREAIIELEQKGLVVSSPPKGVKVAPLPTKEELIEFYDINSVLRGLAARKAIKDITSKNIKHLEEIINESERFLKEDSLKEIARLNLRFHDIIDESSKSKELILLLNYVYKKSRERFSEIISQKNRQRKSIEEHKEILKALKEKDEKLVEQLMIRHIENGKEALLQEIELRKNNNKQVMK
ncbi:MAG: GntR family transcriptional regulator [Candidatus Atribacteria bacterium]|nr:GntR family transcriptional regulator [Candidatus Atribacteria bacterium]